MDANFVESLKQSKFGWQEWKLYILAWENRKWVKGVWLVILHMYIYLYLSQMRDFMVPVAEVRGYSRNPM